MKKIISFMLLLVLLLSLCACGSNAVKAGETQDSTSTQNAKANNDIIEFEEPILVWEDETVKIELICFYQEFFNWADKEPAMEKGITLRYVNKTDGEISIQLQEAYLGMDAVKILHGSGSEKPAPGKAANRNYTIQNVVGSSSVALESMEDLYQLDGRLRVGIMNDSNKSMVDKSYDVHFSFADLISQ